MYKHKLLITVAITLTAAICCCGCNEHAKKKQAMLDKWADDKAQNNLPAAESMLERGDIEQAIQTLEKCLADAPDYVNAHFLLGKAYFIQGDFDKAGKCFATAVDLDSRLAEGWYWLGETQTRQKLHKSALGCYNYAIQLDLTSVDYVIAAANAYASMKDFASAIDLLKSSQEAFSGNIPLTMAYADILMRSGDKEGAIKVYQAGLLFNSDSPELLKALGYCYILSKDWKKAAGIFEKLLADAEDYQKHEYLDILSTCSMNLGDYAGAMGYLDRIKSDSKEDAHLWIKTGQAALGANQPKRAIACAQRALYLRSGWVDAKLLLGCGQFMNEDYNAAVKTFSELLYNDTTENFAWMMTGKCYQRLGESEKAAKAFEKVSIDDEPGKMSSLLRKVVNN